MASGFRWEKHNKSQRVWEEMPEVSLSRLLCSREASLEQHRLDVDWLGSLLELCGSDDRLRVAEKIRDSIAWLREVPTRTLGPHNMRSGWRFYFCRIERALRCEKPIAPRTEAEWKENGARRMLRAVRNREKYERRPDWMSDPSKLPKAPPGRRRVEDE